MSEGSIILKRETPFPGIDLVGGGNQYQKKTSHDGTLP